jgi:hypothetical protein
VEELTIVPRVAAGRGLMKDGEDSENIQVVRRALKR